MKKRDVTNYGRSIMIMSIKNLVITLSIIFIGLAPSVFAQENVTEPLRVNIEQAIDMALEASEDLKMRDNEVLRKKSERKEESSYLSPHILGEAEWSNNFAYPDIAATAATKDYHTNMGLKVSQTIFTFGRISSSIAAAKKAVEVSRFDKEGTKQEVIYNTKMAYYNAYLAERTFDIAEESYENAKRNKAILEDRVSSGRVSKYDNIKIAADIASRMPTVNNARADYFSAMETLKVVIGSVSEDRLELVEGFAEEYSDLNREALALLLYNNQPAIKALGTTVEEKGDLINSKKAAILPEISAFAAWNHKGDSNDYYVGNDNMYDYGVAGLKVNIPIWFGGISREKLFQAKIDKNDAELQYKQGQENYLLELDKAVSKYREFVKTLEANREAIRLAEEAFKLSQDLFKSGQISVTDLNDTELQLTNGKVNKEITLFNLNITLARIERLTLMGKNNE